MIESSAIDYRGTYHMFFSEQYIRDAVEACHYISDDLSREKENLKSTTNGLEILINELHPTNPYRQPTTECIRDISIVVQRDVKYAVRLCNKIKSLTKDTIDEEANSLIARNIKIRNNASEYVSFINNISRCGDVLGPDIQTKIEEGIKNDKQGMISIALLTNEFYGNQFKFLDANVVMRQAAAFGATQLLTYLVSPDEIRPETNVLSTGKNSKKTALQQAIGRGQVASVEILLKTLPAEQLLIGTHPNRALDILVNLEDKNIQASMLNVIKNALEFDYASHEVTKEQRDLLVCIETCVAVNSFRLAY